MVASALVSAPLSAELVTIDFRNTPDFGGRSLTYEIGGITVRHEGGAVVADGLDLSSDHVSFFEEGLAMVSVSYTLKPGPVPEPGRSSGFLRFHNLNNRGSFNHADIILSVDQPGPITGLPDEFQFGFSISGQGAVLHSIQLETEPPAETRFRRGDSNGDGSQDISDPVFTLSYLFSAAIAPQCLDALDVDDDGQINITDPVGHLAALFVGGIRPHEPFLSCGEDPTDDGLECESFTPCL